jgi:hypothetical protein
MDLDAARQAAGLDPLSDVIGSEPTEPTKEHGHARGTTDDRRLRDNALRGIPLIGTGPGCIQGTRPGDSAADLNQAARDIVIANLALQKAKAEKLRQVRAALRSEKQ